MSIALSTPTQATGFRRLSRSMLVARERADAFAGLPTGTAKPLTYLAGFQEAEPYLGLPAHAFKLVAWLVKQTMDCDWERGSRPIAWPSARRQQEFLGLSAARVKTLNRALFEAGIFVIRDNEQGKRYGRRGPDKRIIEAYGFDLSPLAQRHQEFVRIAAEAKAERSRMKDLRKRVTIARRSIRQLDELLGTSEAPKPSLWTDIRTATGELVRQAARAMRSDELRLLVEHLEVRQAEAESLVRETIQPVDTSRTGFENEPLTTSTNPTFNLKDTVMVSEPRSAAERSLSDGQTNSRRQDALERPREVKIAVHELMQLAPRLGQHIYASHPDWRDAIDAAGGPLRQELGVSASLWAEACGLMGREAATLALAIVSTKDESHFTRSAGGYFAGMLRKCEKGQLFLEKTIWALRAEKFGRGPNRKGHEPHDSAG